MMTKAKNAKIHAIIILKIIFDRRISVKNYIQKLLLLTLFTTLTFTQVAAQELGEEFSEVQTSEASTVEESTLADQSQDNSDIVDPEPLESPLPLIQAIEVYSDENEGQSNFFLDIEIDNYQELYQLNIEYRLIPEDSNQYITSAILHYDKNMLDEANAPAGFRSSAGSHEGSIKLTFELDLPQDFTGDVSFEVISLLTEDGREYYNTDTALDDWAFIEGIQRVDGYIFSHNPVKEDSITESQLEDSQTAVTQAEGFDDLKQEESSIEPVVEVENQTARPQAPVASVVQDSNSNPNSVSLPYSDETNSADQESESDATNKLPNLTVESTSTEILVANQASDDINEVAGSNTNTKTLVDEATGVSVQLSGSDVDLIDGLSVQVLENSAQTGRDLYDINLLDSQGNVVNNLNHVILSLPLGTDRQVSQAIYVGESGTIYPLNYLVEDGMVKFAVNHFSKYGLVYATNSVQEPVETTVTGNYLPATGEETNALLLVGAVLLILGAIILFKRPEQV